MGLNKARGNMYNWCTHTFNVIKGECPHQCSYCYCKRWGKQSPLHFDEKELKTDLGSGNFIFVGSSCDMWADDISLSWIAPILGRCFDFPNNRYLFQSKNPARFGVHPFPKDTIIGTTIETNRDYHTNVPFPLSKAPQTIKRVEAMIRHTEPKMVSIEPILDFDLPEMTNFIKWINPKFVSIGADSKGHNLPEPPPDKIKALIKELQGITTVKIKDNLKRLTRGGIECAFLRRNPKSQSRLL